MGVTVPAILGNWLPTLELEQAKDALHSETELLVAEEAVKQDAETQLDQEVSEKDVSFERFAYSQTKPEASMRDTVMRRARKDDPIVLTQAVKATRHYVFHPGTNRFFLVVVKTRHARNVDGLVHYFSDGALWRHIATQAPQFLNEARNLEWWEQDMPQDPSFAFCVVSDSRGRRLVFWTGGNDPRLPMDSDARCAALRFLEEGIVVN